MPLTSARWVLIASVGIWVLLLSPSWASPISTSSPNVATITELVLPSQDPWYTAPKGFENTEPGEVLCLRKFAANLTESLIPSAAEVWNILFRTTDSLYKPTFAVTTVLVPKTSNSTALLSYQVAYDSVDLDASPSYDLYGGDGFGEISSVYPTILSQGWLLSVPDFEGPLASFTAGVISGHAVLDSVRAVLSLSHLFNLSDDAQYAMWGYSGGALASEWAAELQVQYAPEMKFAGAALGGLTPNVSSTLVTISGTEVAGFAPPGIIGLSNQFPDVLTILESKLKTSGPFNATKFLSALHMDLPEAELAFFEEDITLYFVDGLADILSPSMQTVINSDGLMGYHGVPQMPLYVYKAIQDKISLVGETDDLVDRFCGIGVNILYERNTIGGHAADFFNEVAAAFAWVESLFNGTYTSTYSAAGCTIRNVTIDFDSSPT